MPQPEIEEQEEPLDPAMERIRRKMVLLQLVSGGIMFLCFMAVLGAIVAEINQRPDEPSTTVAAPGGFAVPTDQPLAATAALPAGFEVEQVSLSGSQILFYGRIDGGRRLFVFDLSVGRIVADVTVGQDRVIEPIRIAHADDPRIEEFRSIRERDLGRHGRFIAEGTVVLRMLAAARAAP